jgi:3-hydroxybutyryl-CoA dehydratase
MYVGKSITVNRLVTGEDIERYAFISGDYNPLHVNKDFAEKSQFGEQIVQGNLIIGWLTGMIATNFPGPGALLVSQEMRFRSPVFINSDIELRLTLYKHIERAGILYMSAQCVSREILCVDGSFKVYRTDIELKHD